MLFHKSIISFVAAIALATIAAAAAIPPTTGTGSPNQGSSQPEGSSQGTQGSTQGSTLSQGQIPTCSISNLAVKFPEFHGFLRFSQSPETGNRETGKLTHGKNSSYLKSPN